MPRKLLYATSNPGKLGEVGKILAHHNIDILNPEDLSIDLDPEETGNSLEENALIKFDAYIAHLNDTELVIMTDDTGVEIDALGGEPGIHVRRWKGYRMEDEEIINYSLERMMGVVKEKRGAQFRTVIAVGTSRDDVRTFDGILRGEIVEKPIPLRISGFPFESIFMIPQYQMMLGEIHQLSPEEKANKGFHSHREKAILNALDYILELV